MMERKKGIVFIAADSRVYVSRLFSIVVLLLALFTGHSFSQEGWADLFFEVTGLFLLTVCSMGRLWALMYISGNKRRELITDGPYSIVRHPLYLFSLVGAVGVGLVSENLLILGLIVIFYVMYYPSTIVAEERKLAGKFGETYLEYVRRTPRFIPKFSLYKGPESYNVKTSRFVRNFVDGMWFVWIFILLHTIEMAQSKGYLTIYWKVP